MPCYSQGFHSRNHCRFPKCADDQILGPQHVRHSVIQDPVRMQKLQPLPFFSLQPFWEPNTAASGSCYFCPSEGILRVGETAHGFPSKEPLVSYREYTRLHLELKPWAPNLQVRILHIYNIWNCIQVIKIETPPREAVSQNCIFRQLYSNFQKSLNIS